MGINFDEKVRALLILCSLPESWNGMVIAVSNFVSGSSTLKYDDVIGVILSEENHRKTSGGSILESSLNAQSRGRMTKRGNNSGNQEEGQRKRGLNPEDQETTATMVK